jgi:mannose-6-phosphate isomerase
MMFKYFMKLSYSRVWRTYIGGKKLDEIAGKQNPKDGHFPEIWLMSVVQAFNAGRENICEGLNYLEESSPLISLKEAIENSPEELLGVEHTKVYGANPGILVKLIDAAERLTIQVHPTREKARALFGSSFGKTECWYCLGGRVINGQQPCIYLGFKEGISKEYWRELFDKQDITGMLNCLHKFDINPGDIFLVEGGIPHAIGAGCFLVEIQEPTDYTIRVERTTPAGLAVADAMCHQGLGFDRMFECFDYNGLSGDEVRSKWKLSPKTECIGGNRVTSLVGYEETPFFKMELLDIPANNKIKLGEEKFLGLYVLSGSGTLSYKNERTDFCTGDQFFLPATGVVIDLKASTPCKLLRFFGPEIAS